MNQNQQEITARIKNDYDLWGLFAYTLELVARARTIELRHYGLTREQTHILRVLSDSGGKMTLSELSSHVLRKHNSVSAIISRMEKQGLVKREKSESRKHYQISLTPKGIEIFKNKPTNSLTMAFASLSVDEKKELVSILEKLEKTVRHMLGLDYTPPFL